MAQTKIPSGAQLAIDTLHRMKEDGSKGVAILRAAMQQPGADEDFHAVIAEFVTAALAGFVIDVDALWPVRAS